MDELSLLRDVTVTAGNKAEKWRDGVNIERKEDDTFVTQADKDVEGYIISELTEYFGIPVVGEEGSTELDLENVSEYFVVDPIDGTQNYVYNQPLYGTSICLVRNSKPYAGVFYMPELGYCFSAQVDEGAYLNYDSISVSENTDLVDTYCVISGYNSSAVHSKILSMTGGWSQRFCCAIQAESWISNGWLDFGVFGPLYPWDVATGLLFVREAGGYATHIKNQTTNWNDLMNGCLIMANSKELATTVKSNLSDDVVNTLCEDISGP